MRRNKTDTSTKEWWFRKRLLAIKLKQATKQLMQFSHQLVRSLLPRNSPQFKKKQENQL